MRPVFKKCRSRGSRKIKLVEGDYATRSRRKPSVVPGVRRYVWTACGEVFLDYEAVKQIESYRFPGRRQPFADARPSS